jgi:hypothetical protein
MLDTLAVTREDSPRSVPTPTKANSFQSKTTENVRTPALSVSTAVVSTAVSSNRLESTPDGPQWLARINHYRRNAGEQLVSENSQLSDGDRKHARYLVKNYSMVLKSGGSLGAAGHDETLNLPWSSPEGKTAAQHSHYFAGCKPYSPDASIEWWMSAPFHRFQILSPKLLSVGYGSYFDEEGCWAACLDLKLGPESAHPDSPIQFPPDGTTTSLQFVSGEWPDPLASCPGYAPPSGLPITLQLGWGATPNISKESIVSDGKSIEHCTFSGATYSNPDPFVQEWGRSALNASGAVTLIPREPLTPGRHYTVSLATSQRTYEWSFTVDRVGTEPATIKMR